MEFNSAFKGLSSHAHTTNSIQEIPLWEANSLSRVRESPPILWNMYIQYHIQEYLELIPILDQMNKLHTLIPCLYLIVLKKG
jgi:hypothetical protein